MVDIQTANISVPGSNPASPKVENSEDRQGLGVQYCKITDLRGQKKGKIWWLIGLALHILNCRGSSSGIESGITHIDLRSSNQNRYTRRHTVLSNHRATKTSHLR